MIPMLTGTLLALVALAFVLYPLFREPLGIRGSARSRTDTRRVATAVDALREIEFDHATGKLSERDYADLKASYTRDAIAAMRKDGKDAAVCGTCGPRPEADATFCSDCGRALAA